METFSNLWNSIWSPRLVPLAVVALAAGGLLTYGVHRRKLFPSNNLAVGEFLVGVALATFGLFIPWGNLVRGGLFGVGATVAAEAIVNTIRERRRTREGEKLLSFLHAENELLRTQIEVAVTNRSQLGTAHDLGFNLTATCLYSTMLLPLRMKSTKSSVPTSKRRGIRRDGAAAIEYASMLSNFEIKLAVQRIVTDMNNAVKARELFDEEFLLDRVTEPINKVLRLVEVSFGYAAGCAFESGKSGAEISCFLKDDDGPAAEMSISAFIRSARGLRMLPETLLSCTEQALGLWARGECKSDGAFFWWLVSNYFIGLLGRDDLTWKAQLLSIVGTIVRSGSSPVAPENIDRLRQLVESR